MIVSADTAAGSIRTNVSPAIGVGLTSKRAELSSYRLETDERIAVFPSRFLNRRFDPIRDIQALSPIKTKLSATCMAFWRNARNQCGVLQMPTYL